MTAAHPVIGEVLLAGGPVESIDTYLIAHGGGEGLRKGLGAGGLPRSSLKSRARVSAGEAAPAFPQGPNGRAWLAIGVRRSMSFATVPRVNQAHSRTGICCARTRTSSSRAWRLPPMRSAHSERLSVSRRASRPRSPRFDGHWRR